MSTNAYYGCTNMGHKIVDYPNISNKDRDDLS